MRQDPVHVRVFVSSPGDVVEERAAVLDVLAAARRDPLLVDRLTIQEYAHELPYLSPIYNPDEFPQETVNKKMITPPECDVVVVIFGERMGTPLAPSFGLAPTGRPYRSGTEYEFWTAMAAARKASRPTVLLYRRWPLPVVPADAPDRDDRLAQRAAVDAFFAEFQNPDASYRGGYTRYQDAGEFRTRVDAHLRRSLAAIVDRRPPTGSSPIRRWAWAAVAVAALGAAVWGAWQAARPPAIETERRLEVTPPIEVPNPDDG